MAIITSCCDVTNVDDTIRLVLRGDGHVFCSFGAHPKRVLHYQWNEQVRDIFLQAAVRCGDKFVAWGECGLDYSDCNPLSEHEETIDRQKFVFGENIGIAVDLNKPLQLHSRDSEEDFLEMLDAFMPPHHPCHWHSAVPTPEGLERCLKTFPHMYFGVSGFTASEFAQYWPVENALEGPDCVAPSGEDEERSRNNPTTARNPSRRINLFDMIRAMPLERIVLETDAPHFTVRTGGPTDVLDIAADIADIKGIPVEAVLKQTEENTFRLYGIRAKKAPPKGPGSSAISRARADARFARTAASRGLEMNNRRPPMELRGRKVVPPPSNKPRLPISAFKSTDSIFGAGTPFSMK